MPIREINPQSIPNNSGNSSSKSLVPTAKQSKEEIFIPETPKYTFEDLVLPTSVKNNCIRILSPHLRWGTRWSRSFA